MTEENLARDPHRPQYHFLPPSNWMNDPNGLIQWNGRYHLFYQYNPNGPYHGTIHWGHAVSEDLTHWTDLPIALTPTPGGPDQDGCYSGCAVDNDGVPTLIYTGVRGKEQLPCVATSTDPDLLTTWEKHAGNPVIPSPPEELDLIAFRDHCVWREDDGWYQIIGSGIKDAGGAALLYRSANLLDWEYLHPLYVGDSESGIWTGSMWECPEFFALDGTHVLVASVWDKGRLHYTVYFTGEYQDHRFTPETQGKLDHGSHFYAPQSITDERGRRLMWGWLREGRGEKTALDSGWSGMMSLPRLLSVLPGGFLGMEPAPELETLRGKHYRFENVALASDTSTVLESVRGDSLEILAEFEPGDAAELGIKVRCSPDGAEQTPISYDAKRGRLKVAGLRDGSSLELAEGETLKMRVFLDRSVVEVFANGRTCVTELVYPSRSDSLGLEVFARGGNAGLRSIDIWEMDSIWKDGRRSYAPTTAT